MSHARHRGFAPLHGAPRVPTLPAMDDPRLLLEEGRFEELAQGDHPLWRGLALLELKRWPEAARTFEGPPDAGESGIWPGPVAGFLLGHLDRESFLEEGYSDPHLEARRQASVHFWAALKDPSKAREHYQAAVANEGAAVLEVEHHLAHGELAP